MTLFYSFIIDLYTSKKVRYIFQLWYIILSIAAILYKQVEDVIEFITSMSRIKFSELSKYGLPGLNF